MRALRICMTPPKSCALAADRLLPVSNFIWLPPARKCKPRPSPLASGCGACIGLGRGLVEKGETAISATNRNVKGRMGDREALVYLGSPAVVAASALAGFICGPKDFV